MRISTFYKKLIVMKTQKLFGKQNGVEKSSIATVQSIVKES